MHEHAPLQNETVVFYDKSQAEILNKIKLHVKSTSVPDKSFR